MNKVFRVLVTEYKEHELVVEATCREEAEDIAFDQFQQNNEEAEEWAVSSCEEWSDGDD